MTQSDVYALKARIAAFEAGLALAEMEMKGGPGSGPQAERGGGRPKWRKLDAGELDTESDRGGRPPVNRQDAPDGEYSDRGGKPPKGNATDINYQRMIEAIQTQYERDMADAARSQDAGAAQQAQARMKKAMAAAKLKRDQKAVEIKGGPGSGNFGHAGRPGHEGGSAPRGGGGGKGVQNSPAGGGASSAAARFDQTRGKVMGHVSAIRNEVEAFSKEQARNPRDWGYAGTMGHLSDQLSEIAQPKDVPVSRTDANAAFQTRLGILKQQLAEIEKLKTSSKETDWADAGTMGRVAEVTANALASIRDEDAPVSFPAPKNKPNPPQPPHQAKMKTKMTIQAATKKLSKQGYKLGPGNFDLRTKTTTYEVTRPDGKKKIMTPVEIEQLALKG